VELTDSLELETALELETVLELEARLISELEASQAVQPVNVPTIEVGV